MSLWRNKFVPISQIQLWDNCFYLCDCRLNCIVQKTSYFSPAISHVVQSNLNMWSKSSWREMDHAEKVQRSCVLAHMMMLWLRLMKCQGEIGNMRATRHWLRAPSYHQHIQMLFVPSEVILTWKILLYIGKALRVPLLKSGSSQRTIHTNSRWKRSTKWEPVLESHLGILQRQNEERIPILRKASKFRFASSQKMEQHGLRWIGSWTKFTEQFLLCWCPSQSPMKSIVKVFSRECTLAR